MRCTTFVPVSICWCKYLIVVTEIRKFVYISAHVGVKCSCIVFVVGQVNITDMQEADE